MHKHIPTHLQAIIEEICRHGCASVNEVIADLQQSRYVACVAHLDATQKQQLLDELCCIMSVYQASQNPSVFNQGR